MKVIGALALLAALTPGGLDPDPSWMGVSYICSAETFRPAQAPQRLVMLAGMGSGGFQAQAGDAHAQDWLTYGLKLYHAFYHEDAKAAFAKAVEADPNCSLCAWGVALGLGPTLNFEVSPEETAKALDAAKHAQTLAKTALERELAAIAVRRYQSELTPKARAERYADEMADLAERHPEEGDLTALAAHALITPSQHGPRVERAVRLLEQRLAQSPDDTAAIHYYIHATEFAGRAAVALPYAERLAGLAPGASHLVHMAAHTLFRVGRYEEVAVLDAQAMKVDAGFAQTMNYPGPLGAPRYYAHNMMFGAAGALMAGDRELALKFAEHAPVAFPTGSDATRRAAADLRGLIAQGRYAPRKMLTLQPPPGTDLPFHLIFWRYARGEAQAALGDAEGALKESREIAAMTVDPAGGVRDLQFVAAKVLAARAAMIKGKPRRAAKFYAEAAVRQEKALSATLDPPMWWYPVRRSIAAALLKAGDAKAAAVQARASLAAWPNDALALKVLSAAERKLGDTDGAARDAKRARAAWKDDPETVSLDLI